MTRRLLIGLALAVVAAGCGGAKPAATAVGETGLQDDGAEPGVVRLLFGGDVMLGRRVAAVVESDSTSIFEDVRLAVRNADVAVANLEAPFGNSARGSEHRLIADPAAAQLLADAGFDAMAVANNHAGDAGPDSVANTADVLLEAGLPAIGLATDEGPMAVQLERNGIRIAFVAFDLTRQGPPPGEGFGVAHWDVSTARPAIEAAAGAADLVAVSLHGGVEYLPQPDPGLTAAARQAAEWGADVVWAHGSHVTYEVELLEPNDRGRRTLVAYGLGNFLFDQRIPGTESGLVLEVIADADGVAAYRTGTVEHEDLRVSRPVWATPPAPAAWVGDAWWALSADADVSQPPAVEPPSLADAEITAVHSGDVDGDGDAELAVAFLRAFRPTLVNQHLAGIEWTDAQGRSAHLGIYEPETLEQVWVAGAVPQPVTELAVCGAALAVRYRDGSGGAWQWRDFGFAVAPDVAGVAWVGCSDVDGDGLTEPVVIAPPAS